MSENPFVPWYAVHAEHSGKTEGREWSSESQTWLYPKGSAVENVIIELGRDELNRAEACVQACAGMDNPVNEIFKLREKIKNLEELSKKVAKFSISNEYQINQLKESVNILARDVYDTAWQNTYDGEVIDNVSHNVKNNFIAKDAVIQWINLDPNSGSPKDNES